MDQRRMTPPGFFIRDARTDDRRAILAVLRAAFGRSEEARLVEHLWAEEAMETEHVAETQGVVIGYCGYSRIVSDPPLDGLLLGLAPLAVAPDHQRRGAGLALVEHGLQICRAKGAKFVVVLGEPEYYRRFGFGPAAHKNISWAAADAGDAFQLLSFGAVFDDKPRRIAYHSAFDRV